MEATKITEHTKYLSQVAVTLSTEEKMQLEYAFDQLQSAMQFESLHLWGKINGKYHRAIENQIKSSLCLDSFDCFEIKL